MKVTERYCLGRRLIALLLHSAILCSATNVFGANLSTTCINAITKDKDKNALQRANINMLEQAIMINAISDSDARYRDDQLAAKVVVGLSTEFELANLALSYGAYLNFLMVPKSGHEAIIKDTNTGMLNIFIQKMQSSVGNLNKTLLFEFRSREFQGSIRTYRDLVQQRLETLSSCTK